MERVISVRYSKQKGYCLATFRVLQAEHQSEVDGVLLVHVPLRTSTLSATV